MIRNKLRTRRAANPNNNTSKSTFQDMLTKFSTLVKEKQQPLTEAVEKEATPQPPTSEPATEVATKKKPPVDVQNRKTRQTTLPFVAKAGLSSSRSRNNDSSSRLVTPVTADETDTLPLSNTSAAVSNSVLTDINSTTSIPDSPFVTLLKAKANSVSNSANDLFTTDSSDHDPFTTTDNAGDNSSAFPDITGEAEEESIGQLRPFTYIRSRKPLQTWCESVRADTASTDIVKVERCAYPVEVHATGEGATAELQQLAKRVLAEPPSFAVLQQTNDSGRGPFGCVLSASAVDSSLKNETCESPSRREREQATTNVYSVLLEETNDYNIMSLKLEQRPDYDDSRGYRSMRSPEWLAAENTMTEEPDTGDNPSEIEDVAECDVPVADAADSGATETATAGTLECSISPNESSPVAELDAVVSVSSLDPEIADFLKPGSPALAVPLKRKKRRRVTGFTQRKRINAKQQPKSEDKSESNVADNEAASEEHEVSNSPFHPDYKFVFVQSQPNPELKSIIRRARKSVLMAKKRVRSKVRLVARAQMSTVKFAPKGTKVVPITPRPGKIPGVVAMPYSPSSITKRALPHLPIDPSDRTDLQSDDTAATTFTDFVKEIDNDGDDNPCAQMVTSHGRSVENSAQPGLEGQTSSTGETTQQPRERLSSSNTLMFISESRRSFLSADDRRRRSDRRRSEIYKPSRLCSTSSSNTSVVATSSPVAPRPAETAKHRRRSKFAHDNQTDDHKKTETIVQFLSRTTKPERDTSAEQCSVEVETPVLNEEVAVVNSGAVCDHIAVGDATTSTEEPSSAVVTTPLRRSRRRSVVAANEARIVKPLPLPAVAKGRRNKGDNSDEQHQQTANELPPNVSQRRGRPPKKRVDVVVKPEPKSNVKPTEQCSSAKSTKKRVRNDDGQPMFAMFDKKQWGTLSKLARLSLERETTANPINGSDETATDDEGSKNQEEVDLTQDSPLLKTKVRFSSPEKHTDRPIEVDLAPFSRFSHVQCVQDSTDSLPESSGLDLYPDSIFPENLQPTTSSLELTTATEEAVTKETVFRLDELNQRHALDVLSQSYPGVDVETLFDLFHLRNQSLLDVPWTELFKPATSREFIGNGTTVKTARQWLKQWKARLNAASNNGNNGVTDRRKKSRRKRAEKADDSDFVDSDEDCSLPNPLVIEGATGVGKTSLVYALAAEFDMKVIEFGCNERRSGKIITSKVEGATHSHRVGADNEALSTNNTATQTSLFGASASIPSPKRSSSISGVKEKQFSVILFDDADVNFPDDDGFLESVQRLATESRVPIVLTCAAHRLLKFDTAESGQLVSLEVDLDQLVVMLQIFCLSVTSVLWQSDWLRRFCAITGDPRRALLELQTACAGAKRCDGDYHESYLPPPIVDAMIASSDEQRSIGDEWHRNAADVLDLWPYVRLIESSQLQKRRLEAGGTTTRRRRRPLDYFTKHSIDVLGHLRRQANQYILSCKHCTDTCLLCPSIDHPENEIA